MNRLTPALPPPAGALPFRLTDVFGAQAYSGNPLPVVFSADHLGSASLLRITQEFAQFETVFVARSDQPGRWHARVFDLIEELPFAGHPLLGAAVAIVDSEKIPCPARIELLLGSRRIDVQVSRERDHYLAKLDAGCPAIRFLSWDDVTELVERFGLAPVDVQEELRPAVVDTGLRYVVLPVSSTALARARILQDIGDLVRREGAQFAVLVDPVGREIRHWNNDGLTEDIATGSAASVVGGYLVASRAARAGESIELAQGRFLGRPSKLGVDVEASDDFISRVLISGRVHLIGEGRLTVQP